jgi:hypothetical protein
MLGANPSYDFRLFDIGWMSPLQANEFGAATSFRASDPTSFVDFSLNQLAGLLNPRAAYPYPQRQLPGPIEEVPFLSYFQGESAEATRERLRRVREEADRLYREAGGEPGVNIGDVFRGRTVRSGQGTGPIVGDKVLKSDGDTSGVGVTTPTGGRIGDATKAWFASLPAGAGVFLVGVAALIFILLFARK